MDAEHMKRITELAAGYGLIFLDLAETGRRLPRFLEKD
jgi:hypothetical protein